MKKTVRKNITDLPYSLHDAHMNHMRMKGNDLRVYFDEGYYDVKDDNDTITGCLEIKNVDIDFCHVYILREVTKSGKFIGQKYNLKDFIGKYPSFDMEIIDERYGYNESMFTGWMYDKRKIKEFIVELYHVGDMIYITKE